MVLKLCTLVIFFITSKEKFLRGALVKWIQQFYLQQALFHNFSPCYSLGTHRAHLFDEVICVIVTVTLNASIDKAYYLDSPGSKMGACIESR